MAVHKHALRFDLQEALILKIHIRMLTPSLTIYLLKTNHNVILPSLPRCSDGRFFLLYQNYTHIVPLVSLVLDTCPAILTIPRVLYEQPSSSFFNVLYSSASSSLFCPHTFLSIRPIQSKRSTIESTATKLTIVN